MAATRTGTSPRLQAIDPDALARSVGAALSHHLARLAVPASPGLSLRVEGDPDASGLALTAADLCRYAQSGELGDWGDASCALDAAQSLVEGLYQAPAHGLEAAPSAADAPALPAWTEWVDLATDAGLVVACALVRAWSATGASAIPATWLAAFLGVSDARVRQWIGEGGLSAETVGRGQHQRSLIDAASARAWLDMRKAI